MISLTNIFRTRKNLLHLMDTNVHGSSSDAKSSPHDSQTYHSAEATIVIDKAISLITQVSSSVTKSTRPSVNKHDLLLVLNNQCQTLLLIKLAIQAYEGRPLGEILADDITPEVERCCVVLLNLSDKVHTIQGIGDIWRQVFQVSGGDELTPLAQRLNDSLDFFAMFLASLNSYVLLCFLDS